ncbi:MAG: hypothetical protein PQJ46_16620 [Spirochaetales bacterium]|nr:hypothetical protein [Spirochaetales bacterium]
MIKKFIFIFQCFLVCILSVTAEKLPKNITVAVLNTSSAKVDVSEHVLKRLDEGIMDVFSGIIGCHPKQFDFSISEEDIISFLRNDKTSEIDYDDKERRKLLNESLIVAKSMIYYSVFENTSGWETEIQVSFNLIEGSDLISVGAFTIDAYGEGPNIDDSLIQAINNLCQQADFEIRAIDIFKGDISIAEVMGRDVIIEFADGVKVFRGSEFNLIGVDDSLSEVEKTGLVVISKVKENSAVGRIIYSNYEVKPSMVLKKSSRFGIDANLDGRMYFGSDGLEGGAAGVKFTFSKGFYGIRPFLGIETPFLTDDLSKQWSGFPLSPYLGGEFLWNWGRFQIRPSLATGITFSVPLNSTDEFAVTHIGLDLGLSLSLTIFDFLKIELEGGYNPWMVLYKIYGTDISSYGGIYAGISATFKL